MRYYLWQLRPYFRQTLGQLVLASICGIVMNVAVVLPSILLGRAIDAVLAMERGETDANAVGWAALAFVGGTMLYMVPRMGKRWWFRTSAIRMRANIRADALRGVLAWPMSWLHQEPIGNLMARIVGDAEVLGESLREVTTEAWDTWLFSLSLIVAMLTYAPDLTALALLPVPAAMLLAYLSGRWVRQRTAAAREANARLTTALQEYLSGIRVLRLFGRANMAVDRVAEVSQDQAERNLATLRLGLALQPIYTSLMTAGVILVIWLAGHRVIDGAMTPGAFITFLQLYLRFVGRGYRIPVFINRVQSGSVAYDRLQKLLARPMPLSGEPPLASFRTARVAGLGRPLPPPPSVPSGPLSVSLEDVTLQYPGSTTPALCDVSLSIPAGSLVAVTGPVGSGKSALARALLGLYPLDSGQVLVDGRPLNQVPPAERAIRIGYMPQDPGLFSGSVTENILLGRSGSDGSGILAQAISCAALEEDVRAFPNGLNTEIGEAGIRVSGGQRQRIAFARVLAASAPQRLGLLVLDDPFAAVDVDTEAEIMTALRETFGPTAAADKRVTIVLCSHRLTPFPAADLVVVLDGGRIVARGTHEELLQSGGLYARIYSAQHPPDQAKAMTEEPV